uniref:U19-Theraphotoxin-Sfo1a_1 n=1 Tax=Selenotholus foelschei TaxID=1905327 RepID=A0A482Z6J6_9ARAC
MKATLPFLTILFFSFVANIWAYTYVMQMDTSDGYCEFENQRAAIGETFYGDDRCEEYYCGSGQVSANGCGSVNVDVPGCRLERGQGRYPDCCEQIVCD